MSLRTFLLAILLLPAFLAGCPTNGLPPGSPPPSTSQTEGVGAGPNGGSAIPKGPTGEFEGPASVYEDQLVTFKAIEYPVRPWDPEPPQRNSGETTISWEARMVTATYKWSCDPASAGTFYNARETVQFLASTVSTDIPARVMVDITHPDFPPDSHVWEIMILNQPDPIGKKYVWGGDGAQTASYVAVDPSGNVFILGTYDGETDFNPDPDAIQGPDTDETHGMYLSKFSSTGRFQWVRTWELYDVPREVSYQLVLDNVGGIYVSNRLDISNIRPHVSSPGLTLRKFSQDGSLVWTKEYPAEIDSFAVNRSGEIAITGNFQNRLYLETAPTEEIPGSGIFVGLLDSNGDPVWTKAWSGSSYFKAHEVMLDSAGNVFDIALFDRTCDFDPGPGEFELTANFASYSVSKFSPAGDFQWAISIPGDVVQAVMDSEDNIVLAGNFERAADFDFGRGTCRLTPVSEVRDDVFLVKLDSEGGFIWACSFGGPGHDAPISLAVDPQGNILVGGVFGVQGTYPEAVDFDPGPDVAERKPGDGDVFLSKFDPSGRFLWVDTWAGIGWVSEHRSFAVATDRSGSVYISAALSGVIDFDPGPGADTYLGNVSTESRTDPVQYYISEYSDESDAFFLKLSPDGRYR